MKKIYPLVLSLSITIASFAQTPEKCGIMQNYKSNCEKDPSYSKNIMNAELVARQWIATHASSKTKSNSPVFIPVVFHCVYKDTSDATYLHDSVFHRQIMILNETYSKTNSNFANTRPVFDSIAVNTDIQFCLASVDPQGNPTTGINRFQSPNNFASSPIDDGVKDPTNGGVAPWDTKHYLNIWSCDMSFFGFTLVLGYATFPGSDSTKDGVVLHYKYVGYQTGTAPNNLGRTAVHEVGHWLGMRHIWGDGQQSSAPCDSTDYVDDTPNADAPSQTTCDTARNSCSNEHLYWSQVGIDPPDMVENYMDYSNDGCMTMFTKGQKDRMWSFINTLRSDLLNNPVACVVGIQDEDAFANSIYVYPNPAAEMLTLNFTANMGEQMSVEFFSSTGQVVKLLKTASFQNNINISDLAPGLYFIKITNGHNRSVKKIVVE